MTGSTMFPLAERIYQELGIASTAAIHKVLFNIGGRFYTLEHHSTLGVFILTSAADPVRFADEDAVVNFLTTLKVMGS